MPEPNPTPLPSPPPVIIDTDPGVDDALALIFALRSGLFDVRAITVVAGNCSVDQGVENTFRILEAVRRDSEERGSAWTPPPVYRGAERPLEIGHTDALHVHGRDGLGGVCSLLDGEAVRYPRPALALSPGDVVEVLPDLLNREPGQITLITLGPLTNVARAIQLDEAAMSNVKRIVSMAGVFRAAGNVTPAAEYNVWADPEALDVVLNAADRWRRSPEENRLTLVGLDVTQTLSLTRGMRDTWAGELPGSLSRFLADCTEETIEFHRVVRGLDGMHLHDPLAVLCAARRDLFTFERLHVAVECAGTHTRGMTLPDLRETLSPRAGVPVEVCASVRREEALEAFRRGWYAESGGIANV